MEILTTELLSKRIGRENTQAVQLWVKNLFEEQKNKMVRVEPDNASLEQAKAKFLSQLLSDLESVLNGDRKGNQTVPTSSPDRR